MTFTAGKPLGYLSSWPLFALSNHLLIWHCAQEAYPGRYFDRYGVLGDDVVIADTEVARLAQHYLSKLGVKISYPKSLISDSGAASLLRHTTDMRKQSDMLQPISDNQ